MEENIGIGKGRSGLGCAGRNAVDQRVRRRESFAEMETTRRGVERRDIRKCAADIGGQPYPAARLLI